MSHGMRTHMDGARLMNAVVAAGVSAAEMAAEMRFRLAGFHQGPRRAARRRAVRLSCFHRRSVALEAAARRVVAPGRHLRRRLPLRARPSCRRGWRTITPTPGRLADGLAGIPGLVVEAPETNLVFFDTRGAGLTAVALAERIRRAGLLVSVVGQYRVRACTHLDVTAADIASAVGVMTEALTA